MARPRRSTVSDSGVCETCGEPVRARTFRVEDGRPGARACACLRCRVRGCSAAPTERVGWNDVCDFHVEAFVAGAQRMAEARLHAGCELSALDLFVLSSTSVLPARNQ